MATLTPTSTTHGTLTGPGYAVAITGTTPATAFYLRDGETASIPLPHVRPVIFTQSKNTLGELLEVMQQAGLRRPATWPDRYDAEGQLVGKGLDLGGIVPQDRPDHWLGVKSYDFGLFLRNLDGLGVLKQKIIEQVAYFNLWGLLPGLWAGDPPRVFAERLPGDPLRVEQAPEYPPAGYPGPLDYADVKHLLHYFFPQEQILRAQIDVWFLRFLMAKGSVRLDNQSEIDALVDATGADDGVPVDLSTYNLDFT